MSFREKLVVGRGSYSLNFNDINLIGLRSLVDLDNTSMIQIARNAIQQPDKVQLMDFIDQVGLDERAKTSILKRQNRLIPEERKPFLQQFRKIIQTTPTLEFNLSQARINQFTEFEDHPPLLFGIGGGSRALNKALPLDVLSMILTAEKLRKGLSLGKCRILCANDITYTNIPKNPEFTKETIDRVMIGEREILRLVLERFKIGDHWDVFLGTDIDTIISKEAKEEYDEMVADADKVPFVGGHHYSMEIAEMWSLIGRKTGGLKLGWFMRYLNKVRGGYIMDEQPFDARYAMYLAYRQLTNKTSIPYVHAGVKIFPGKSGMVDKESPYICYDPTNRILLSPFERPEQKLSEAYRAGGGLRLKQVRKQFVNIIKLFEEIILGTDDLFLNKTKYNMDGPFKEKDKMDQVNTIGARLQSILDFIFDKDRREAEKVWRTTFPYSNM